jgi:hypothetical protein
MGANHAIIFFSTQQVNRLGLTTQGPRVHRKKFEEESSVHLSITTLTNHTMTHCVRKTNARWRPFRSDNYFVTGTSCPRRAVINLIMAESPTIIKLFVMTYCMTKWLTCRCNYI